MNHAHSSETLLTLRLNCRQPPPRRLFGNKMEATGVEPTFQLDAYRCPPSLWLAPP